MGFTLFEVILHFYIKYLYYFFNMFKLKAFPFLIFSFPPLSLFFYHFPGIRYKHDKITYICLFHFIRRYG